MNLKLYNKLSSSQQDVEQIVKILEQGITGNKIYHY